MSTAAINSFLWWIVLFGTLLSSTLSFHVGLPWSQGQGQGQRSHNHNHNHNIGSHPHRLFSTRSADEDWRAFRARLVQQSRQDATNSIQNNSWNTNGNNETLVSSFSTNTIASSSSLSSSSSSSSSSWAYDAGLLVEKGSVVLSRVEPQIACPDLDQPYLGKCVILIVEHDQGETTQGIILNRPSIMRLNSEGNVVYGDDYSNLNNVILQEFADEEENNNHSDEWRMFFGGEISGWIDTEAGTEFEEDNDGASFQYSHDDEYDDDEEDEDDGDDEEDETVMICLHQLSSEAAMEVSEEILSGVYMTSYSAARVLVQRGEAKCDDFFLFYGFCGWDPEQLQEEVKKGSWYLASADPNMLWEDLKIMREDTYDVRSAGLGMWNRLIGMLGKGDEVKQDSEKKGDFADLMLREWVARNLADASDMDDSEIFRALRAAERPPIQAGSLLRGSSQIDTPYLFEDQYLHKSIVLILQEDERKSVGAILNLPTTETYSLRVNNNTHANFTIRHGGPESFSTRNGNSNSDEDDVDSESDAEEQDEEIMLWLHCCAGLKYMRMGSPLAPGDENGVWTCTEDQVAQAIDLEFASVDDFMLVKGVCAWEKEAGSGGAQGQLLSGRMEIVLPERIDSAWTTLRRQIFLKDESFWSNVALSKEAWDQAADEQTPSKGAIPKSRLVPGSQSSVEDLADAAFTNWIKIHLLEKDKEI